MATQERAERSSVTRFLAAVNRSVLIVVFTGVETIALAAWLALVIDAPLVSTATAVGLGALAVGLVVEHLLTDAAVNGLDAPLPGRGALVVSLTETGLWALWLVVAERVGGLTGVLVAGAVLAVLLVPQHTVEDNLLRGRGLFASLVDGGTVGFSVVEAAGATAWLALVAHPETVGPLLARVGEVGVAAGLVEATAVDPAAVGLAALALALFVEHAVGVSFSRRG